MTKTRAVEIWSTTNSRKWVKSLNNLFLSKDLVSESYFKKFQISNPHDIYMIMRYELNPLIMCTDRCKRNISITIHTCIHRNDLRHKTLLVFNSQPKKRHTYTYGLQHHFSSGVIIMITIIIRISIRI